MADEATEPTENRRQRIVVGIDGSPGADAALRWAYDEASLRGADLEAVVAWDFIAKWAVGFNPEWPEDADHLAADATTVGDRAVNQLLGGAARPSWLTVHAVQGSPAYVLTEQARQADLLVVGARGRGGFAKLRLGSVSSACLHHATCPITVIPSGTNVAT